VKWYRLTLIFLLGILFNGMPCHAVSASKNRPDSLILQRMFNYRRNYTTGGISGHTSYIYVKRNFHIWKRNFTLWVIPSMYSVAGGDRSHVTESYNKVRFNDFNDYDSRCLVSFSTIRHNRYTMPITTEYLMPNLYDTCLYPDHILSPFNRHNRHYYRYRIRRDDTDTAILTFKPRFLKNTQLISGEATVDKQTGRIIEVKFDGEYDMMRFHTEVTMGVGETRSLLPNRCKTHLVFKFMGNSVYFNNEAVYDCNAEVPDSLDDDFNLARMDSIRPIPLNNEEQIIRDQWAANHQPDTTEVADTTATDSHHFSFVKNVLQDAIGDNLISSIRFENERGRVKMSPILDPQYISYSSTHGFAYKIKLGANYNIDSRRSLEFQPWCGYNFKYKKFYFTLPFYYNYNPQRNGQVMIVYGNGNRITNGSIIDEIRSEQGDTVDIDSKELDYFDDNYLTISNNIKLNKVFELATGFTYHRRIPYEPEQMWHYGKPQTYNSFAPMLTLKITPWRKGPIFSVDYERGIKGILGADSDYERWEFDGSLKHAMEPQRRLNAKVGGGFYTRKKTNYFVDYIHFRDNKLPGGWDDDWSGDFQLLDSRWYNESKYYARAHLSYESPFLVASWIPLLGRIFERERFYLSALSIDRTRPYSEYGYGFSTRFVSIGLFTSFLGSEFQGFDCKFTFELFRRW